MNIFLAHITPFDISALLNGTSLFIIAGVTIAFVIATFTNLIIIARARGAAQRTAGVTNIMRHALEIGGINVIRFDMRNLHVENRYGAALPSEGLSYQEYRARVHPDDRELFARFMNRMSQHVGESGEYAYRWNAAAGDGAPVWRNIHNNAIAEGRSIPLNVVCTISDETETVTEQREERDLTERYRSIFDRSVVGLSFYDKNGMLLAANQNMREIFHMQGQEDPLYYQVSLFRRAPFRDLVDIDNPEEIHFCTKIVMPERGLNNYLEIRFNPVFDAEGKLQNISVAARDITEERELYRNAKQNDLQIRQANNEIQQYEEELQYLLENCDMRVWRTSFKERNVTFYRRLSQYERKLTFDEFETFFIDDSGVMERNFADPEKYFKEPVAYLCRMKPIFHDTDQIEWNMLDCVPIYDKDGKQEGCFGTIRNVSALIEAQEKLKEETRRANDSAKLKSVFMANMTHEIRTPLNAIVGFSDVLSMIESPEDKKEMIRVIMNNCDMLLRLINDILEVSSMDANAIKLEPVDVDFSQAFNDICETLAQRVQEPGVQFIKDNPYPTFPTHLDPRRIQQVVTNFVTNAVKYTHQGHIKVGYRVEQRTLKNKLVQGGQETKQGIYIYCEDTGAGIPKEKQASVFERFVKLNDYVQGTGLGLSICKAIATRAGGQIGVASEGEGKGSTFWMWVPCEVRQSSSE